MNELVPLPFRNINYYTTIRVNLKSEKYDELPNLLLYNNIHAQKLGRHLILQVVKKITISIT